MTITITIRGLQTLNESNQRSHFAVKAKRIAEIRREVTEALMDYPWDFTILPKPTVDTPWKVVLWRLAPPRLQLDDDGVVSALKSVRDAVAAFVGVDDRHRNIIRYEYDQEWSAEYGVRITIDPRQLELAPNSQIVRE